MAFELQPTLAEIVAEVLSAIGEGGTGVATPATVTQCQTMARRAQKRLYHTAAWTINRTRFSQVLAGSSTIVGTQSIDWPDQILPGHIVRIDATKVADPRQEWTLEAGITPDDRSTWNFGGFSTNTFTPYKWDTHDGLIELGPVNKADVNIIIEGDSAPSALRVENDRPGCDGEAVIRLTEILLRNSLGGDYRAGLPALQSEFLAYLEDIKPKQGSGKPIVVGAEWAIDDPARPSNWTTTRQRHWMWRSRRP
jgi:hypothetical protein